MSYARKVERQRAKDKAANERRLWDALEHQKKLDRKRTRFVGVSEGKPDVGPNPDVWKRKTTTTDRRQGVIRRMMSKFGSIFTGQWVEIERRKELLAKEKAETPKAQKEKR